jgi:hypothetical protein
VHFCLQPYVLFTLLLPLHMIHFLHLLSTNNKCTQPYYFSPATQTRCSKEEDRLQFFDEELSATCCPGCRSCGVMESSAIIVFRDIIYVIIILYSWHVVICEHFWPYVWTNWSWVMLTMRTWFWHINRVWQWRALTSGPPAQAHGFSSTLLYIVPAEYWVSIDI